MTDATVISGNLGDIFPELANDKEWMKDVFKHIDDPQVYIGSLKKAGFVKYVKANKHANEIFNDKTAYSMTNANAELLAVIEANKDEVFDYMLSCGWYKTEAGNQHTIRSLFIKGLKPAEPDQSLADIGLLEQD